MCGVVWFTDDDVMACAGADRYEHGLGLYEETCPLRVFADHVVAMVGDDNYQVHLTGTDRLIGECSCPAGRSGVFCEHCVAAALMALDVAQPPNAEAPRVRVNALCEPGKLTSQNLDRWANNAEDLLLTLEQDTVDYPAMTRPLYQRLLRHLVHTDAYLDTDEVYQVLMDVAARTIAGLTEACVGEPMDPDELADWVLDLQLEADLHVFVDLSDLDEALGARGVATYQRRLDEMHRTLPPEDPYDEDLANRHAAIAYLREQFLLAFEPDVEVLKAFSAENPSPGSDRSIAEALRSAGRIDKAISWLEGMQQRGNYDGDDTLAELYELRGRHRDAARIRWKILERVPHQSSCQALLEDCFRALLAAAEPLNAVEYAKNRTFAHLRERAARSEPGVAASLVHLLVAVGDIDQAWEAAQKFDLDSRELVTVARRRAERDPADAIPILLRAAEHAITHRANKSGYTRAVELLSEVKELHQRAGWDFADSLERFKAAHHHKRPLLTALAKAGL
jgi:tetratricopeptide (TPR) repeat protein